MARLLLRSIVLFALFGVLLCAPSSSSEEVSRKVRSAKDDSSSSSSSSSEELHRIVRSPHHDGTDHEHDDHKEKEEQKSTPAAEKASAEDKEKEKEQAKTKRAAVDEQTPKVGPPLQAPDPVYTTIDGKPAVIRTPPIPGPKAN